MTVDTYPKYSSRPDLQPLKPEHVLQLIHKKRKAGKTSAQILDAVEIWLYNVMVSGGVILEQHGTNVSAKLEAGTGSKSEEV